MYHFCFINIKLMLYVCIKVYYLYILFPAPNFSLNGVSYPNNSIVLRSEVGDGPFSLQCVSDDTACCGTGSSFRGEYFFPGDIMVQGENNITNGYFRDRSAPDHIQLNRRGGTIVGLFHCRIKTVTNRNGEDLYIGVYDENTGKMLCNS